MTTAPNPSAPPMDSRELVERMINSLSPNRGEIKVSVLAMRVCLEIHFAEAAALISNLQSQVEEGRKALEPFAKAADVVRHFSSNMSAEQIADVEADGSLCAALFSNGAVRHARTVYTALLPPTSGGEGS